MCIVGHTLVWHSQAPDWVFYDEEGNRLTREALLERMKEHIDTVVGRYRGRVHGWDVVNEALLDDGADRKSTRLNSSHVAISYAVFCLKKKKERRQANENTQE